MLQKVDGKILFDFDRCQQCGVCREVCPTGAITYSRRDSDCLQDIHVNHDTCILCGRCVKCCPPAATADDSFDTYADSLAHCSYYLGYNEDAEVRYEAASGGVARTLIIESLRRGLVDGVYAVGPADAYPFAKGRFYSAADIPAYSDIPTSVYHSVMAGDGLRQVPKCGRLMIVGTACQLTGLERALRGRYTSLVKVCIFCKQQKSISSTRFLAKAAGAPWPAKPCSCSRDALQASYRGKGWPGTVTINGKSLPWSRAAQLPFGRRLWTVPGCNICGDPAGINAKADIALMDPWKIEAYGTTGKTLIISHTDAGAALIKAIPTLKLHAYSYGEVLPALDVTDIRRKQMLTGWFRGRKSALRIRLAGALELWQRRCLSGLLERLPRLPMIAYRALCKLPDLRRILLPASSTNAPH